MKPQVHSIFWLMLALCLSVGSIKAQNVNGRVMDHQGHPIVGATVHLIKAQSATITDDQGQYEIKGIPSIQDTLVVSYIGYSTVYTAIKIKKEEPNIFNINLTESTYTLNKVTITGKSMLRSVEEKAYNVQVLEAQSLHHTTLDIGHALDRISGIRVRENGGVGSQMNISLNGFRGRQVRFFIDGIPMDNFGSSFQLNNLPISIAQRIEVYKGVVPVGLGADALGGAINIITKTPTHHRLDLSYAIGSFNTHRLNLYGLYVGTKGFYAEINAFANYSDNSYKVEVDAADIHTGAYFPKQNLKRFHDTYHNQTLIGSIGLRNKNFADLLSLNFTLGQNYREIQTGARIVSVFGAWHRRGNIIMPALKYKKKDFIINNLEFNYTAQYNLGSEQNIDTLNRRYNWLGQYKEYPNAGGERSYSTYKYRNNNALMVSSFKYTLSPTHQISVSHTLNRFDRKGSDALAPDNEVYEQPRKLLKSITGLSYQFSPNQWESAIFVKNYYQENKFRQSYNPTGNYGDVAYRLQKDQFNYIGYGLALSHFFHKNLQVKVSYEKSYRMPETEELFGDLINLRGNLDLKPEQSHNYNLGTSLWHSLDGSHRLHFSTNLFYRDAKDFIRPRLDNNQTMQIMDNLGKVTNKGLEAECRYAYKTDFQLGLNATYQDLRNNTRFEEGQTTESVVYKDRIPNMPFFYGNMDASYTFHDVWKKGYELSLGYNGLYVHSFYLYWPSRGRDKLDIPEQIAHDLNISLKTGSKIQWVVECRNIADSKLYDNFSLQKPGRSFTLKFKYTFF